MVCLKRFMREKKRMKFHSRVILSMGSFVITAVISLSLASMPGTSRGQAAAHPFCDGCSVDGKSTPMTPDGHPDLNGFWNTPRASQEQFQRSADGSVLYDFDLHQGSNGLCSTPACQVPNQPPYKDEYMTKVKALAANNFGGTSKDDPMTDCKPLGIPRAGLNGVQIVQSPRVVAILYENLTHRVIYIDGRPHPSDLEHSYFGDSIGHWEGNTLVVDTIGLNDDTWLGGDVGGRHMYTTIHSNKEHATERISRQGDVLTYDVTIEDPVMFTRPWVLETRHIHIAKPGDYLLAEFCAADTAELLKAHFQKPNPNDRDIKNNCAGHVCDGVTTVKPGGEN
jgi:hypothetical protein